MKKNTVVETEMGFLHSLERRSHPRTCLSGRARLLPKCDVSIQWKLARG
jgi:hypothetical protein